MDNSLILTIKGLIIGIGKVIPGVSGSLLAIILNVYEECLERVGHLFKDFKDNLYYLGSLGIGILISIVIGSRVLSYLLNHYYFYTMFTILGLIVGIIPSLIKKIKIETKKDILYIIIPTILVYLLEDFGFSNKFIPYSNFSSYCIVTLIGFLEAITTIIPGISGTATFMMLGVYDFVLELFSNPFTIYFPFYIIGLIIGIIIVSKIMTFLFKKYHKEICLVIISLTFSSLFVLLKDVLNTSFQIKQLLIAILLFTISYYVSHFLNK